MMLYRSLPYVATGTYRALPSCIHTGIILYSLHPFSLFSLSLHLHSLLLLLLSRRSMIDPLFRGCVLILQESHIDHSARIAHHNNIMKYGIYCLYLSILLRTLFPYPVPLLRSIQHDFSHLAMTTPSNQETPYE